MFISESPAVLGRPRRVPAATMVAFGGGVRVGCETAGACVQSRELSVMIESLVDMEHRKK